MDGAQVVLAVNITVAAIFVFGHAVIGLANRDQRAALWFCATYLIGLVSPVSDFLVPLLGASVLFEWLSYSSFLLALLSISATVSIYHRKPPPWATILTIFVAGIIVRAMIWDVPRSTLGYGIGYQGPFVLAAILATSSVWRTANRRPLHVLLAATYAVVAAHFLVKPFLAATLGMGARLEDYTKTTYALLSQASTGILLLVSGVILLLIVAQKAITDSLLASETDPLSLLLNRRGFERQAQQALLRAERSGGALSLAMLDLDHFKRINDAHGHDVGDRVIQQFATLLREVAPGAAIVARLGGEEFAIVMEGAGVQTAWLHTEAVRLRAMRTDGRTLPCPTVSAGLAELRAGETMAQLLRRADQAAYAAKEGGRNRVCLAPSEPAADTGTNVVRLQAKGGIGG